MNYFAITKDALMAEKASMEQRYQAILDKKLSLDLMVGKGGLLFVFGCHLSRYIFSQPRHGGM